MRTYVSLKDPSRSVQAVHCTERGRYVFLGQIISVGDGIPDPIDHYLMLSALDATAILLVSGKSFRSLWAAGWLRRVITL